ncbi:hypothetical protein AA313_de0200289 [Arthrobotrys entomopaga]|nr:hypothetical protein AA313_de0200289 [Arthrobotrys entomopaga]
MATHTFYPSSPIAVAAGATPEGTADCQNAVGKISNAIWIAFCSSAIAAMTAAPAPAPRLGEFWNVVSQDIVPFFRKYEYDNFRTELMEATVAFVVAVSKDTPDKHEMAGKLATLASLAEVCQVIIKADFAVLSTEQQS